MIGGQRMPGQAMRALAIQARLARPWATVSRFVVSPSVVQSVPERES